jgi:hypothetical protein
VKAGYCGSAFSLSIGDNTISGDNKCSFSGDTARSCKDASASRFSGKTWQYPITTFRSVQQ